MAATDETVDARAAHRIVRPSRAQRQWLPRWTLAVERYGITADLLADAMARLAFTDLDQLCAWGTVMEHGKRRSWLHLHDSTAIERPALAAISEIRRSAGGELSVKLFNKREAIMDLARLKGWIADKPVDQRSLVMLKIER